MTKTEPVVWDRHAIRAEIGRKGLTMEAIAKKAGLESSQVRHGLRGNNKTGALAIARALKLPFRTLFPDSYLRGSANEVQTIQSQHRAASQNEHVRDDKIRGAA